MNDAPGAAPETQLLQALSAAASALSAAARTIEHPLSAAPDPSARRSVVGMMDGAAEVIAGAVRRYPAARRPAIPQDAREQMGRFINAAHAIIRATTEMERCERVTEICGQVRLMRADAEAQYRKALLGLETGEREPIHLLAWRRDLHQRLLWAIDRCGYAAHALERLCSGQLVGAV